MLVVVVMMVSNGAAASSFVERGVRLTYVIEQEQSHHQSMGHEAGHVRRGYGVLRQSRDLSKGCKHVHGQEPAVQKPVTKRNNYEHPRRKACCCCYDSSV